MSVTEKDFILRAIKQIGDTIARIAGLRAGGQNDEALLMVQESVDGILGPMAKMIEGLDAASAAMLLESPDRIRAYGLLVAERAITRSAAGDVARAPKDRLRAIELLSAWTQKTSSMDGDVRHALEQLRDG